MFSESGKQRTAERKRKIKEGERYPEDECVHWRSGSGRGAERRICILNELDVSMSTITRSIKLPSGALLRSQPEHVVCSINKDNDVVPLLHTRTHTHAPARTLKAVLNKK